MLEMAMSSIGLFLRGKLFAEPGKAMTQLLIGVLVTAAIFLIAAKLAGAAPWLAAVIAGSVGGALQPYLFKDLRYR